MLRTSDGNDPVRKIDLLQRLLDHVHQRRSVEVYVSGQEVYEEGLQLQLGDEFVRVQGVKVFGGAHENLLRDDSAVGIHVRQMVHGEVGHVVRSFTPARRQSVGLHTIPRERRFPEFVIHGLHGNPRPRYSKPQFRHRRSAGIVQVQVQVRCPECHCPSVHVTEP
eukprot:693256-Prorocentrum_minimum.AAC.20